MAEPATDKRAYRSLRGRLSAGLASCYAPAIAVALALTLTLPALRNGLDADDYYHRAVMLGSPRFGQYLGGPQDMFRFLPNDPERTRKLMALGFLPWWTYPHIKAEFLQFLTVQTHVLDYWLWPDRPALMHAHSLAWLGLLVFLVAILYRRLLGATWMAGAAALLFAVEDAHGTPAGWICNRNVLLAASFGVACLIAHDCWRRDRRRLAFGASLLFWACSLFSKEAGIATSAYLIAYALWIDKAPLARRALSLLPYALVLIGWRMARGWLGYGVENLGIYIDPITDPLRFLLAVIERYPVLLLGQFGFPPSDLSVAMPRLLGSVLWWWALLFVGLLVVIVWPLLRREPLARFFVTGLLLAAIPICATQPSDRLLMFVGLGAMGLIVLFWRFVFASQEPRPQYWPWRVMAIPMALLFVLLHVFVAPALLVLRASNPIGPRRYMQRLYIQLPFDADIEHQDLVVVNPPSAMHANYCLLLREFAGQPVPRAIRSLAPSFAPMTLRRVDQQTLEITPRDGYLNLFLDRLFRNEEHPLRIGEEVALARMTATVLSLTEDGRPATVSFRFERPLEDISLRWIRWQRDRFVPFTPPAVGAQQQISFSQ